VFLKGEGGAARTFGARSALPFVSTPVSARREVVATLRLAFPLALTQLAQITMSFVDVMMIGRLGPEALAGGVVGATVFFFFLLVCMGVVMAVSPSVAQAHGAADEEEVSRATRQGLWLALLLSAPLLVLFQFGEPLLRLARQEPQTAALASDYLQAIRWGAPFNLAFTALRGFCEGLGRPRPVLAITLGGSVLNVAGNYVLMYGKLGLPALGLVGAAWSSAIAMTAMALALGLYGARASALRRYHVFAWRRPEPAALRRLFRLGAPIGMAFGLEAGLFSVSTLLVGWFGAGALAAHQVALNAASVTFMVPLGIGMAATVRVGHAVGQGDPGGARRAGWAAIGLGASFMLGSALLFWLRPGWVVWVYTGQGAVATPPEVTALAGALLGIAAVFQLFDGTQATAAGALRGLKDTRAPMLIGAVAYWGVGMGAALALGFGVGWGPTGIWWGLTLGLAAAAFLLTARFHRRTRALTPAETAAAVPSESGGEGFPR